MPTSATKELENASSGEKSNGVVAPTTKRVIMIYGLMEYNSNIMRCPLATHGKKNWIGMNKETRSLMPEG